MLPTEMLRLSVSKLSLLLRLLCSMTEELTFEKFHQWAVELAQLKRVV